MRVSDACRCARGDVTRRRGCAMPTEVRGTTVANFFAERGEAMKDSSTVEMRPPLPPFTHDTAVQKTRLAEDAWNTHDPDKVASAYSIDSRWRNRSEFVTGREAIVAFLRRKWAKELDYRLIKELWAFDGNHL